MRIAPATAGLLISLFTATTALAQTDPAAPPPAPAAAPSSAVSTTVPTGTQAKGVSLWGILPWAGIGVGGRFMLPLNTKPLLSATSLHDTFALEFGADFLHRSYDLGFYGDYSYNQIIPVFGVMWELWVNEHFAFYPKVEVGWGFGWHSSASGYSGAYGSYGGFYPDGAGGVLYKLDSGLTLRAEAGITGLKLGVGWLF
jgi:hypothetical protein